MPEFSYPVIFFWNYGITSSCHCSIIPISIVYLLNKKFTESVYVFFSPIYLVKVVLEKKQRTHHLKSNI
jgi:hypothetical protein